MKTLAPEPQEGTVRETEALEEKEELWANIQDLKEETGPSAS